MVRILIGADRKSNDLKEYLKDYLECKGYQVGDATDKEFDLVKTVTTLCKEIITSEGTRGIMIEEFGVASFMIANKHKGIICAEVSDEHSAHMTINHNNTSIITIGSGIVGRRLAEKIVDAYLETEYASGRHQIRVDMLNKML